VAQGLLPLGSAGQSEGFEETMIDEKIDEIKKTNALRQKTPVWSAIEGATNLARTNAPVWFTEVALHCTPQPSPLCLSLRGQLACVLAFA
jgi:hypothetical protein